MHYIPRAITPRIEEAIKRYPVITITGPRQTGKSTLCKHLFPEYKYVTLERIATRSLASSDPQGFVENLGRHAIIDEVQHVPELLSEIQVIADQDRNKRYILTGSSNFSLMKSISQSLAGRTALFTLLPFSFDELNTEIKDRPIEEVAYRGFYPGVLANGISPTDFYENYYDTYVERDLRDLLRVSNLLSFDKFVRMLALRVGSEFNASALSREVGVSSVTISEWLSILVASYIVFELPPYHSNPNKSLTKNKKIYFHDTGLLCSILGFDSPERLTNTPLWGAIFENLAVSSLVKKNAIAGKRSNLYFYRENKGIEVDVIEQFNPDSLNLYEIKAGKSLHTDYSANMKTLASKLCPTPKTTVIYNGDSFPPIALNIRDI